MPKTKLLRTVALLIPLSGTLLFAPRAEAAKWIALDSKGGARIEVDESSLDRASDDKLRVWHRETYAKPRIPDNGAFSFTTVTTLTEFQCARHLAAPLKRIHTAANDSELKSESFDGKDAAALVPDSILESVAAYVCKPKTRRPSAPAIGKAPTVAPLEVKAAPPPEPAVARKKGKPAKEDAARIVETPWHYEGKIGPGKWATLSPDYALCGNGQRQSPIDIRETIAADLPPIRFDYKPVALAIVDNGHTVQVNTPGAGSISVDGEDYELLHLQFHKPGEQKINGKSYDMSVHLVHKAKSGKQAIVAVMLQAGKEQRLIRTLWNNLPLEQKKPVVDSEIKIDPTLLLPATRKYFAFIGSLSAPPCTEGVLWLVLKTPMEASREQIASFGKVYKNNARPTQAGNARVIKESR